ncbi:MAG: hypothetical protein HYU33_04400 [Candidatus Omnitrophica bacterium]|nr:hypothetical protein [Candidatus Omnitrophota bacterium]MBI3010550.1 hypothetical protein [Candidatus Omnitrophota bacterium]
MSEDCFYIGQTYLTKAIDFVAVANAAGAEKFITVNYVSGIPSEAADWVCHANVVNDGNVLYGRIGNKPFG